MGDEKIDARLDFPSPPLSAPGSLRMMHLMLFLLYFPVSFFYKLSGPVRGLGIQYTGVL